MSTPSFETLQLEVRDRIGRIRLVRPALANRFDALAHAELADALAAANRAAEARVIVLSAEGRIFSAGGDFDEILAGNGSAAVRERMVRDARRVFHGLVESRLPIVVAVQGAAVGLGATIVSLCDVSVAYAQAKISDPHVAVGIVAGDGGIVGWVQSMGMNRARRFLLTGDSLTAREAHAMGLITDLVDTPDEALPRALAIAERIASLPRLGVEGTRRAFALLTQQTALPSFEAGLALEMDSMAHPDVLSRIAQLRR
jgi:enoyl-CoA hydratase